MLGTGILENTIIYKKTTRKHATHFALCNGKKIRYLISLNEGKERLIKNISSYSIKLEILMKVIRFLPFSFMEKCKLGYFIEARICEEVQEVINNTTKSSRLWNLIVGTYDKKQKLVIQVWDDSNKGSLYYKIGNCFSNKEMITEIKFLSGNYKYKKFNIPNIIYNKKINDGYKFNIQVTEEFNGNKVKPVLTEDIYDIFKELVYSRGIKIINGIPYGFSHGDFAPWNLKIMDNSYTLFDWEHCGMRFYGFDLIHYVFQVENLLNGKSKEESIELAVGELLKREKFAICHKKNLIEMYFNECKNSY